MSKCTGCKGTGEMTIEVHESGRVTRVNIQCIDCNGSGVLTVAQVRAKKAAKELWCRCKEPGDPIFFDDGEHPDCSKHCYTCNKCGKILQVG